LPNQTLEMARGGAKVGNDNKEKREKRKAATGRDILPDDFVEAVKLW
jgi:hypothetical protein